jgi:perosamine synthetase
MDRISVAGPWITQKEVEYVTDAVKHAWYSKANVYHDRFEKAFAEYLGVRFAIALPSCTSAIHLALVALGVGAGDEVIVPEITWIASAAPVTYVGATIVFADVDSRTWCLSGESFQSCVTPKTKAVIPVDLYGNLPDMDAIQAVARGHGIAIIEDAAQAIGAQYKGKMAGSFGDAGVFSFHGSKTLTTGEGGMLVTDLDNLYERALILRDHGRKPGDKMFFNAEIAYKYKMSSMQAALGLAQLERLGELISRKQRIFSWYFRELDGFEGVTLNYKPLLTINTYWMVTAIIDPKFELTKGRVLERMSARKIDCRPFFHPLSSLPAFRNMEQARRARERNAVSYRISPWGINLPSSLNLTEENVRYVCDTLKKILHESRRTGRGE